VTGAQKKMEPLSLVGALALAAAVSQAAPGQTPATPTFARDIAPLLRARCQPCHQADGDAPFPLATFAEVRRRASQIREVTARRYMPPWKPAADSPEFVGDRRLRPEEIDLIDRWVKAGAPEGDSAQRPQPPQPSPSSSKGRGWLWGEPDLVLTLPPYALRAEGLDVFRNFVVTVPGSGVRYVRALQLRPGSRAVHHANIRIDSTPASRALDEADPAPGYEGVILHSADYPDGHFLGWTPGQAAPPSDDLAWTMRAGTDLVVQLHMRPTGRVEQVAPRIGLYFAHNPPARTPAIVRLGRQNIDIPAAASDYRTSDAFVLPVDAQVVSIQPHAHYRARDVAAWARLPDGSSRTLMHIADWDFRWQDVYRLASPLWLPAGTTLAMEYSFDNSAANPRNPERPPVRVSWGWRSSDEMGDVWIQLLTRSDADRVQLARAARRQMTQADAIGSEVLIAREPTHVNLRNDAALIYRELGRPRDALEHFAAITRLQPRSPSAHYNEGVTLEALGREDEAIARYREAIRLDPSYALAHAAMGNYFYRARRLDEAMAEYRAALTGDATEAGLKADPTTLVNARCSLARALTETRRPSEAVAEYRAALTLAPDSTSCLINFAWLLSAHLDATVRQPREAIQLAERAVELTGRHSADALDVLAAAYASAGRFDAAVRTGEEALRLSSASSLTGEIRARVDLYRRHVAFVVPDP
jgi:tetratricopeptide (TPR) repeat protein/mono/diheme cytochrome c family protein